MSKKNVLKCLRLIDLIRFRYQVFDNNAAIRPQYRVLEIIGSISKKSVLKRRNFAYEWPENCGKEPSVLKLFKTLEKS